MNDETMNIPYSQQNDQIMKELRVASSDGVVAPTQSYQNDNNKENGHPSEPYTSNIIEKEKLEIPKYIDIPDYSNINEKIEASNDNPIALTQVEETELLHKATENGKEISDNINQEVLKGNQFE
jgi:hypothetical protein